MDMVFFSSWESLARTLVVGVLAYAVLVLFLRISVLRPLLASWMVFVIGEVLFPLHY